MPTFGEISPCDIPFSNRIRLMFSPNFFYSLRFIIPSLSSIKVCRNSKIYYNAVSGAKALLFPTRDCLDTKQSPPALESRIHGIPSRPRENLKGHGGAGVSGRPDFSRDEADGAPFFSGWLGYVRHTIPAGNSAIFFNKIGSRKVEEGAQNLEATGYLSLF